MRTYVLLYIPVLHLGYKKFLEKYADADAVYVLGEDIIKKFTHLSKEIRELPPSFIVEILQKQNFLNDVRILDTEMLQKISKEKNKLIMPDEDIMHELALNYFSDKEIIFDSTFLRWDKHNSIKPKPIGKDVVISQEQFDQEIMEKAMKETKKSSDWWRRVGAVLVKDGEVILSAHNTHVPSEYAPYVNGDPRNNFHKGVCIEASTAIHAEAKIIAEAARRGVSLEGASIYVSTFPCPPCAKLIAYSGIKKIYYNQGYGMLDGEDIMRSQGVEIIFVEASAKKP